MTDIVGAVITVSDRASAGEYVDRSGPRAVELLAQHGVSADVTVVPDDPAEIRRGIRTAIKAGARVVLTTGGTGVGPRDVTVEATRPLLAYEVPGIAEAVRAAGLVKTPLSSLSRGVAGVIDAGGRRAFVFNAPGSRGGARDALAVLGPLLGHIVDQLDGADHDLNRPPSE